MECFWLSKRSIHSWHTMALDIVVQMVIKVISSQQNVYLAAVIMLRGIEMRPPPFFLGGCSIRLILRASSCHIQSIPLASKMHGSRLYGF